MNIRTPVRDGGGPSLVGAIVFAVVVAVNVAAGPEALERSFTQAAAAGRSAVVVVRRAADLAARYGGDEGDDEERPCPPWAQPRRRAGPMKARTCEVRLRCDARAGAGTPIVARPWVCRSRS